MKWVKVSSYNFQIITFDTTLLLQLLGFLFVGFIFKIKLMVFVILLCSIASGNLLTAP